MTPIEITYDLMKTKFTDGISYYFQQNNMYILYSVLNKRLLKTIIFSDADVLDFNTNYASACSEFTDTSTNYIENELSLTYRLDDTVEPTYCLYYEDVSLTGTVVSIFNGSKHAVLIKKIHLINTQLESTTGSIIPFEIKRITGHSGGTNIGSSIELYDSLDTLPSNISILTGATLAGESTKKLKKIIFSTSDLQTDSLSYTTQQNMFQMFFPIYDSSGDKPITIRYNEGVALKPSSSSDGQFDVEVLFTVI